MYFFFLKKYTLPTQINRLKHFLWLADFCTVLCIKQEYVLGSLGFSTRLAWGADTRTHTHEKWGHLVTRSYPIHITYYNRLQQQWQQVKLYTLKMENGHKVHKHSHQAHSLDVHVPRRHVPRCRVPRVTLVHRWNTAQCRTCEWPVTKTEKKWNHPKKRLHNPDREGQLGTMISSQNNHSFL